MDPPGDGAAARDVAAARLTRVAEALPAGEVRPQQLEMCRAVAAAIEDGRHLVVQAGTGTGKSLAYLVPAVLSGHKVVVATATKALQDQLAQKDLPALAAALDRPFTFAVLKGRSNYVCRQRAVEMDRRGFQQSLADTGDAGDAGDTPEEPGVGAPGGLVDTAGAGLGSPPPAEPGVGAPGGLVDQIRRILAWADDSPTGDRAELPFEPTGRAWAMLSVGPRECPGAHRCPSGGRCFAEQARDQAAAADVVVVNTHLYGAHLASGGAVLPDHDVVVFDEAHEVEAVMTSSLGVELAPGRLRALAALARPALAGDDAGPAVDRVVDTADRLHEALTGRTGERVLRPPTAAAEPTGRERARAVPGPALEAADRTLAETCEAAVARVEHLLGLLRRQAGQAQDGSASAARRTRASSAAGHLLEDLARLAARTDDEVAWVDGTPRAPVLRLSPIDVGPPLAKLLWGEVTAVLASATVPPRLVDQLGLREFATDQIDVGSPFDHRAQSLLYVARHLPDRRRPESEAALHRELEALVRAAGGRTLALFTSRRATEAAVEALRARLDLPILAQGDLPKHRLLRQFAEDEPTCLFATMGFWQGVDVPGRSLSLVALDRLPFARPDDPLLAARRERAGANAFALVDLPRAATLLAQGAGRLIRTADDRGVVAVLDPRLATAGYRRVLLSGLPPMRRTTDRRQVEDFLRRALDGAPGAQ